MASVISIIANSDLFSLVSVVAEACLMNIHFCSSLAMSFVDDATRLFGTSDLYDLLQLKEPKSKRKDFSQAESKTVYSQFKILTIHHNTVSKRGGGTRLWFE